MDFEVKGRHLETGKMPDLDFLRDERLNQSATFRDLRSQVEHHFTSPVSPLHPEKSPRWRSILYNSLLTCLREVTFTSDEKEQEKMLIRVQKWFLRKTNRNYSATRLSKASPSPHSPVYTFPKSSFPLTSPSVTTNRSDSPTKSFSVSPYPSRTLDTSRPFITPQLPDISIDETRIATRLREYQQRKMTEMRTILVDKREIGHWSVGKSRLEAESSFCVEQKRRKSPGNVREIRRKGEGIVEKGPILVDLREETGEERENTVTGAKVSQYRQRHSNLLQLYDDSPRRRPVPLSLAFYRPLVPASLDDTLPSPSIPAPLTPIPLSTSPPKPHLSQSLSPLRKAKLVELAEVKRKLAHGNLPCTYRVLRDGLMEPGDLPESLLTPQSLPQGGELLMSNPFFVSSKKKRKVKRRK